VCDVEQGRPTEVLPFNGETGLGAAPGVDTPLAGRFVFRRQALVQQTPLHDRDHNPEHRRQALDLGR
jgi:hypothetical protein